MHLPSKRLRAVALVLAAVAALGGAAVGAAGVPDRLDRFRELALTRQGWAQTGGEPTADAYREMYALMDEEIVESLASGGPFASPGFLQERLDAFGDAWGGAMLAVVGVDRLVVGAFRLADAPGVSTVRVYGRLRGEAALLATIHREGQPVVYPATPAPDGAPQFVTAWEGAQSGRGTRALRLELTRQVADSVRVVWSTAELFPQGLVVRSYAVRPKEIRVRYELHYPGWTPGCEAQTEAEDVYRLAPDTGVFARTTRTYHQAWHQELHATVWRLFEALGGGDGATLAALVPDARLRRRLPAALRAEPACDAPEDGATPPRTVSVAASEERTPWEIVFRLTTDGWRLTRATQVGP